MKKRCVYSTSGVVLIHEKEEDATEVGFIGLRSWRTFETATNQECWACYDT